MNKHQLLAELRGSRDRLEAVLEGLPDRNYESPEVWDGWRLKDVLAHLNRWEGEAVKLLFQLEQGIPPDRVELVESDIDGLNASWYESDKGRELSLILSDLRGLRKQTLRRVSALDDETLTSTNRFPALGDRPLWRWIAVDTFEHEIEHSEILHEWRQSL